MKKKIIKIGFAIIIVLFSSFHLFAQANQQIKFELVNSNLTAKDNDGKDIDFSTYQVKAGKDLVVSLHSDNNIKDLFITISYKNPQNNNTEIDTIKAKTTDLNNGTYSISTTVLKTINENLIIIFFNKNNTSLGKYTIKIDHSLTNVTDNNPAPKPTTSKATGIMFYDAELLKNNKDGSNPEIVLDILSTYTGKKLKIADLDASFQNNTFLKEFIKHYLEEYNKTTQAHAGIEGSISKVSSAISSFDVTTYANALSDIMIQHAKEELTVAFFNRFQKFAANNPEFQVLFPKTTNNLSNLLTYSYPQMLPALRSGFHEDLEQIAYHIDDVLELPKYAELLKNFPEVRVAIRSIRLVHDLETGASNAADIIKEFSEIEDWKDSSASLEFKNMANSVKLAAIFSESVRNDRTLQESSFGRNIHWTSLRIIKRNYFLPERWFNKKIHRYIIK